MPFLVIFHKIDALALDRFGNDDRRLAFVGQGFLQGAFDLRKVVAVNGNRVPMEIAEFTRIAIIS